MAQQIIGEQSWYLSGKGRKLLADPSGVRKVVETWKGSESLYSAWLPSFGSTHADYANLGLSYVDKEQSGAFSSAVLTYTPSEPNTIPGAIPPVGTTSKRADSNVIDIPIEQHPSGNGESWKNPVDAAYKPGVESYVDPQPVFEFEDVVSGFGWSEAEIVSQVGKIASSELSPLNQGMTLVTNANWLLMAKVPVQAGDVTVITYRWQYAENGWDTDVYSAIS